jgi:hypothetical protein
VNSRGMTSLKVAAESCKADVPELLLLLVAVEVLVSLIQMRTGTS